MLGLVSLQFYYGNASKIRLLRLNFFKHHLASSSNIRTLLSSWHLWQDETFYKKSSHVLGKLHHQWLKSCRIGILHVKVWSQEFQTFTGIICGDCSPHKVWSNHVLQGLFCQLSNIPRVSCLISITLDKYPKKSLTIGQPASVFLNFDGPILSLTKQHRLPACRKARQWHAPGRKT